MNSEFWKAKRVFITGHTGFKGSWLSLWLQSLGAVVKGFALAPPTQPNLFEIASVGCAMESDIADIRDLDALSTSLAAFQPDIVFHLAAQPLVMQSYEDPQDTYSTNVLGSVNLLEAVRVNGKCKAVVMVTSDKCYENLNQQRSFKETDRLGGYDPYSNSKACAELVTGSYRNSFFNPEQYQRHGTALASVRAGNVVGGGDWARDRLIPDALAAFAAGRTLLIRAPDAVRPWQHVLDPLCGYLTLAEQLVGDGARYAEAWNFGPGNTGFKPVRWIIDYLVSQWGPPADWIQQHEPQPHEAAYLGLDCSKARDRLSWVPCYDLESALDSIIAWHRHWLDNEDMGHYSRMEIHSYMDRIQR